MKYIKKFENDINKPEVGDYVSIVSKNYINHLKNYYNEKDLDLLKDFLLNYPGQIYTTFNNNKIKVIYGFDIPKNVREFFQYDKNYGYNLMLYLDDINIFSKTIEELRNKIELKNNTNKFNL